MRILHLTDTHLGASWFVTGAPPGWSRADDHLAAARTALGPALRGEVDLVVHSGDVFDRSRPPRRALLAAEALFHEVAVPLVLMPGNHDRRGLSRSLPRPRPGLHVVDRPARLVVRGVALAVVPFVRDAAGWARAARAAVGPGADLLVAHQAFHGARVPGLEFRVGRQADTIGEEHVPAGVRHVLCGHIHPRQVVRVGGAEIVMPGSTERTAFSEAGETKGYALWTLGARVGWTFVDLPGRPLVRVDEPRDLDRVVPGAIVRGDVDPAEVSARGGWAMRVASRSPRPALPPQLGLFGARS